MKINGIIKAILRLASIYGYSPKMHFNLVNNTMTLAPYKYGKIFMDRPNTKRRSVVHIEDVTEAIVLVIEVSKDLVNCKNI